MSDRSIPVDSIRRLAVLFEGMVEAANQLEEIGSYELAIAEYKQKREAAYNGQMAAVKDFEETKAAIARNRESAEQILAEAKKEVETRLQRADAEAEKAISDAKEVARQEADRVTKERSEDLNRLLDEIERQRGELYALNGKVIAARAEAEDAERVRVEKQKGLDAINEVIANLHPVRR
jgi:chromosome segregation ATPase